MIHFKVELNGQNCILLLLSTKHIRSNTKYRTVAVMFVNGFLFENSDLKRHLAPSLSPSWPIGCLIPIEFEIFHLHNLLLAYEQ